MLKPSTFAGASSGTISRQSSGRKPITKFTPPVVVRGSRIAEMVEANSLHFFASRMSNSRYAWRTFQERRFQPEACTCGHIYGHHLWPIRPRSIGRHRGISQNDKREMRLPSRSFRMVGKEDNYPKNTNLGRVVMENVAQFPLEGKPASSLQTSRTNCRNGINSFACSRLRSRSSSASAT